MNVVSRTYTNSANVGTGLYLVYLMNNSYKFDKLKFDQPKSWNKLIFTVVS